MFHKCSFVVKQDCKKRQVKRETVKKVHCIVEFNTHVRSPPESTRPRLYAYTMCAQKHIGEFVYKHTCVCMVETTLWLVKTV